MFEIKIAAATPAELASRLLEMAAQFGDNHSPMPAAAAAPAEDKPKRTRAKAEPAAAAAETPAASKLEPADEGNANAEKVDATPAPAATETATASADDKPVGPTRDDALTAATKFSQTHGVEKLEAALEAVGAKKFSEVPADKYAAFIAEMGKASAASSALS